jgi:hypothetical protein
MNRLKVFDGVYPVVTTVYARAKLVIKMSFQHQVGFACGVSDGDVTNAI